MTDPRLLSADEAAKYLGVRRSHFLEHIRPQIAIEYDLAAPGKRPLPRFDRADLDRWMLTRRRDKIA